MPKRRHRAARKVAEDEGDEVEAVEESEVPVVKGKIAKVAHEYPDDELKRIRHHSPYSVWSGMRYTLILSLLLWWLPTVGQMIAGYVGGRRSGGPWRGVFAAIVPVLLIVILAFGAEKGWLSPWLGALAGIPGAIGSGINAALPPAAPFVDFVLGYLTAFVVGLKSMLSMGTNGYLVTIVFAYIGGILAEQSRREAAAGRGTSVGVSITQPLLAPLHAFRRPTADAEGARFEDLRRIPVRGTHGARARPAAPKLDARSADAGDEEGRKPREGDAPKKAERQDEYPYASEAATRRFVERALRQYEASHPKHAEGTKGASHRT